MADELLSQPTTGQLYCHPTSKQLIYKVNTADCPTDVSGCSSVYLHTSEDHPAWVYNGNAFTPSNTPQPRFYESTDNDGSEATCTGGQWTLNLYDGSSNLRATFVADAVPGGCLPLTGWVNTYSDTEGFTPTAEFTTT